MSLGTVRREIPALAHVTHLNSGRMALLPQAVATLAGEVWGQGKGADASLRSE